MRVKAEIWVHAYLRRCAALGVAAYQVGRGDGDAGAIFIKINRLDGTADLYGPAPAGLDGVDRDRRWVRCLGTKACDEATVDAYLRDQRAFDADAWVLEVEDRDGRHLLDDWLVEEKQV